MRAGASLLEGCSIFASPLTTPPLGLSKGLSEYSAPWPVELLEGVAALGTAPGAHRLGSTVPDGAASAAAAGPLDLASEELLPLPVVAEDLRSPVLPDERQPPKMDPDEGRREGASELGRRSYEARSAPKNSSKAWINVTGNGNAVLRCMQMKSTRWAEMHHGNTAHLIQCPRRRWGVLPLLPRLHTGAAVLSDSHTHHMQAISIQCMNCFIMQRMEPHSAYQHWMRSGKQCDHPLSCRSRSM